MWFGLLLREACDGDADLVTLVFWGEEPGRRIRVSARPDGVADCARMLRTMQLLGARFALPRCPACTATLDVPDVDAALEEV